MIWFNPKIKVEDFANIGTGTMAEFLEIRFTEIGDNFLKATMPVNERTIQPYGLLHGGASCVLAETVGSVASALLIDQQKYYCVGLEINANHLRSAREGLVTATATAVHFGRTTHVWDIRIVDEESKLICISRLTVAIIQAKQV